jgi:hypothetical protein
MHPPKVREQALDLIAEGLNDCEVSRRTGVPRGTIRDWRLPRYIKRTPVAICPRCWHPAKPIRFTADDYAELLGVYLGDGSISTGPRTQRLRIYLDARYPRMIEDIRGLLERCFPKNRIGTAKPSRSPWSGRDDSWIVLSLYSSHLACVFPQHGIGKKHEREIRLESWQVELVGAAPWALIRGLIRTDGCHFVNRTNIHRSTPYEYLSYYFANKSKDIVDVLLRALDQVGIRDGRTRFDKARGLWQVRINRRASVALMLEYVGLKE